MVRSGQPSWDVVGKRHGPGLRVRFGAGHAQVLTEAAPWFPFRQLVTSAVPHRPVHPLFSSRLDAHVFSFSF
jgi:hypothetical protein